MKEELVCIHKMYLVVLSPDLPRMRAWEVWGRDYTCGCKMVSYIYLLYSKDINTKITNHKL